MEQAAPPSLPSFLPVLSRPLPNNFTPKDLDEHLRSWTRALNSFRDSEVDNGPEARATAFINTLPRQFGDAVFKLYTWRQAAPRNNGHCELAHILHITVEYMQKGVPSPAEVSAFDPDSPDAMDGTERCNCPKATCKFCASHFHAVEICPELHYVRELEALKYVKHRPWSPASGAASASNSSSTQASPQVYTGTGQTSTARGSSTFFVVTGASHSLIKDKNLLSNLKRLPTPAMFHPALLRPNSPADITMLAEHAGTLAFRRAGQPSIEIRDVFWCPGAAYNILGMDVIGTDEWRISFGDWSLSHLPTGVRFPFSSPIVAAFDVAHTGPGTAQPVVIGEGDAFALGVTPYKVVNGKLVSW